MFSSCTCTSLQPPRRRYYLRWHGREYYYRKHTKKQSLHRSPVLDPPEFRITLLGAPGAGKTVLFNHFRMEAFMLQGEAADECDRPGAYLDRNDIIDLIIRNLHILLEHDVALVREFLALRNPSIERFEFNEPDFDNEEFVTALRELWYNAEVQEAWNLIRTTYSCEDVGHFINLPLWNATYKPTFVDALKFRRGTNGIQKMTYVNSSRRRSKNVFDVGGRRTDRRKWVFTISSEVATFILFLVPVGSFDERIADDGNVTMLIESLEIFEKLLMAPWHYETRIAIVFTKVDILRTKFHQFQTTPPDQLLPYMKNKPVTTVEDALGVFARAYRSLYRNIVKSHYLSFVACENLTNPSCTRPLMNVIEELFDDRTPKFPLSGGGGGGARQRRIAAQQQQEKDGGDGDDGDDSTYDPWLVANRDTFLALVGGFLPKNSSSVTGTFLSQCGNHVLTRLAQCVLFRERDGVIYV